MTREKLMQTVHPLQTKNGATGARIDVTEMDDRTAKLVARSHFLGDMARVDTSTVVEQKVTESLLSQS